MADELNIDLSNYKDRVGQRVAPGRYRVVVDDVELDKSAAGNDMINVWFRVVGGDFDGAIIIDRLTQTEKALFRTVGFMQGIGLPTPKKRLRINLRTWMNKQLEIDVEDGDPYNGRVKSEVRGYLRLPKGAGGSTEETGDDLDGLDEFAEADEDSTPATNESAVTDDEVDLEHVNLG